MVELKNKGGIFRYGKGEVSYFAIPVSSNVKEMEIC